jgi:hypothetical protein
MNQRRCIFCGGNRLTREHVLGDWVRRLADIKDSASARHTFHPNDGFTRAVDFSEPPLKWVARVVCGECNHGWVSEIDNAAAIVLTPLLQGKQRRLSSEDQGTLATWAFKAGCVIDAAALGGGGPRFPQADRSWLREHRCPPEMCAAWITSWPGTMTAWTHFWGIDMLKPGELKSGSVNAYGATIALGPIVLRVYATTNEALAPSYLIEQRRGVFPIRPASEMLNWQPQFWLSAEELEQFAYAIPQALELDVSPETELFFDPNRSESPPSRPR